MRDLIRRESRKACSSDLVRVYRDVLLAGLSEHPIAGDRDRVPRAISTRGAQSFIGNLLWLIEESETPILLAQAEDVAESLHRIPRPSMLLPEETRLLDAPESIKGSVRGPAISAGHPWVLPVRGLVLRRRFFPSREERNE